MNVPKRLSEAFSFAGKQAPRCQICGKTETIIGKYGIRRLLARDHDHATGAFRGYLCARCNRGIGSFHDNPQLLRRAAAYLEGIDAEAGLQPILRKSTLMPRRLRCPCNGWSVVGLPNWRLFKADDEPPNLKGKEGITPPRYGFAEDV